MINPKILIVDDIPELLMLIEQYLQKSYPNCIIYQSNSGKEAIETARKIIPDIIITDWDMPEMDGIALTQKLKSIESTRNIPIIVASGVMITSENLKIALDAGAIDFLRKPIDPIELIARTNSALMLVNYYKEVVKQKNNELTENSLYLIKVQETNKQLASKIENIKNIITKNHFDGIGELNKLKDELQIKVNEDGWYRFNLSFSKVHVNFGKNLLQKHPCLTPTELKLCSFIRLGMANKEIGILLNQSSDTVKVSRYRLRKKIDLVGSINLETYLLQF